MDPKKATSFFSFGDPEPVNSNNAATSSSGITHLEKSSSQTYYLPPYDLAFLANLRRANAYHGSAITFRKDRLVQFYAQGPLSYEDFSAAVMDFLCFGQCALQKVLTIGGTILELKHIPALNVRAPVDAPHFIYLRLDDSGNEEEIPFKNDEIFFLKEYDAAQDVYGIPDWFGGIQATLLAEEATLFRRKYFRNGCHLGYVFYSCDPSLSKDDEEAIKDKIAHGKGAGNFRTMFIHIPNGKEKAIQIIPVGDIAQRDEFERIKNISAAEILAAHRVPPALMGITPENSGGFGSVEKIARIYIETEVRAFARKFEALNAFLPKKIHFKFNFPQTQKDS